MVAELLRLSKAMYWFHAIVHVLGIQ